MNLLTLCLCAAYAPLIGITRRNSRTLHAVPLNEVAKAGHTWPNTQHVDAACGTPVKIINPEQAGWWAPRIRGTRRERCPECAAIHGTRTRQPPRWARPKEPA